MNRLFVNIYDFFSKRRRLLCLLLFVVVALSLYSASRISFSEDISGFLPQNRENERVNYAYQHIGAANTILVYFDSNDYTQEAIEDFVYRLEENGIERYAKRVLYSIDESEIIDKMAFISANLPYFLEKEDYDRIDSLITPENICKQVESNRTILGTLYGGMMKSVMKNDPLFISKELLNNLSSFKINDNFRSENGFIYTADGEEAVVMIESNFPLSETSNNKKLIQLIDRTVSESSFKDRVNILPFGAAYISVSNADCIKRDSILSISIALVLIVAILIYTFRSLRIMLILPMVLIFGVLFAFGVTSVIYSEISLIAVGISSVIIGIAANYPLHFIDHKYQGYGTRRTLIDITNPLTIGNITTIGAFLSLLFISSPAMKNLGIFASMLLVGTILFVLIALPQLIPDESSIYRRNPKRLFKKFTDTPFEEKRGVVSVVVFLTILFIFLPKAGFNADMGSINYMTDEHRTLIKKLVSDTEDSGKILYVVAEGESLDESLQMYEKIYTNLCELSEQDSMVRLTSIGRYLPSKVRQKERIEYWNSYWADKDIYPLIEQYGMHAGFKPAAFVGFRDMLNTEFQPQESSYFSPLTENLAENFIIEGEERSMILSLLHAQEQNFGELQSKVERITMNNSENIFSFNQESIMSQVVNLLSTDFDLVLSICGVIVLFFLFISFGRLELTLISFLPLTISWIWILALMPLFGMQFNIVNIILATFIFGMGDDYTIFMTEGAMYENRFGKKMLNTYKSTVALSALIMFIGIGSLIIAKHPAMKQLGELVIVGMFSVVVTAFIIPSFFFRWLTVKKGKKRTNPITFKNLSYTIYSFTVFLIGSLYLTIFGFFLLTIGGKSEKHRLLYHRTLQKICKFVLYHIPMNRCTLSNLSNEANPFDKPSMIICNHQSHLDLMALISLTPRIIVFTNRWVWHSPFYGIILRYADFYPTDGMEMENLDWLQQKINEGYSLMMFPEGTRSKDSKIQRFHKGAFYLAERLGLDLLPVIIHGFGYALPKEYLLLKRSELSIHIKERIPTKGRDYRELCKELHKMYLKEYKEISQRVETAGFYADEVINNYIYKGKEVERYVRNSLSSHNNYRELIERIGKTQSALLTNPGMGEISLLAALVCKNTLITALIEDNDDYLTAVNCPSNPSNLRYIKKIEESNDIIIDCYGE